MVSCVDFAQDILFIITSPPKVKIKKKNAVNPFEVDSVTHEMHIKMRCFQSCHWGCQLDIFNVFFWIALQVGLTITIYLKK